MSENSSLLSGEDCTSERVRFDDNVSFIDDSGNSESVGVSETNAVAPLSASSGNVAEQPQIARLLKVSNNVISAQSVD